MRSFVRYAALFVLLVTSVARAAETETQYLSGLGKDDPVKWEFMCDKGMNANKWSTIGVPSNWQLQGFGIYEYGRPNPVGGWPRTHGVYKRVFTTPATWRDKTIFVKFEGVMTDAAVTINRQSAGPVHQGGYYAFKYDITSLLKPAGQKNEIQVDVDDDSMNNSVNNAERRGDYWNYSGIFRPVYLEAVPKTFVDHVAIKATATGSLDVDVTLSDTRTSATDGPAASVEVRVLDASGRPVGSPITAKDVSLNATANLSGTIPNPRLWSAETPNLYQLEVQLKLGNTVIHTVRQKFGFRTIELRPGQGLFVNGKRVFLKGVDRHSFWPDSGRTLSEQISRDDINVIKDLNANAVRSSHYPPDRHFLDACDELGIYVLDELAGWHQHYDTDIGQKLVKEMVEHDVNHPSILFWDNGNEGGGNPALDGDFAKYDPQNRVVLHPWAAFPLGIADTKHYPTYEQLLQKLSVDAVYFPTEMLHGLYDGGAGAGLNEYWDAILKSKAGGGGFLWAFLDEDVKRVDKGGILDSADNQAPDGIVGPYREREGSFYTVKQLWSPIIVTPPDGTSGSYTVTNRYSFTNADRCTFEWETIAFRQPNDTASGSVVLGTRTDHGRSLAPGTSASWDGWGPPAPAAGRSAKRMPDATRLRIKDSTGRVIQTYVWPSNDLAHQLEQAHQSAGGAKTSAAESGDTLTATAGDLSLQISKTTGLLVTATRQGKSFSLVNGPRVVAMGAKVTPPRAQQGQPAPPPPTLALAPDSRLTSLTHETDGNDLVISAAFAGPMKSLTYRLKPNGWLSIDYDYAISGEQEYFGVGFDYPEADVKGMRFLGKGPATVYQNRLAGGTLDVWNRPYNNTIVGDPDDLKPGEHFNYPVFKGYYSGVRWLQLNTSEGPITAMVDQRSDSPIYVQILTPKTPPADLLGQTGVPFPNAGVSFLHAIPAVGSKFVGPLSSGFMGQPAVAKGDYKGHISLYFGNLLTH
ncbi:MAG TPA: glycoside hydrolase family 2 TIM barrel-domain containing protein [Acidobacteriaceae bacterium]|nr:glycoside hydrolase family 2 TIM barrel-domain containing protein [Acidobacteriaceae bacterium]